MGELESWKGHRRKEMPVSYAKVRAASIRSCPCSPVFETRDVSVADRPGCIGRDASVEMHLFGSDMNSTDHGDCLMRILFSI